MSVIANALMRYFTWAGSPVNGTSGTFAGDNRNFRGVLLVDTTNNKIYMNTNTVLSPTWTEQATSGAALSVSSADMAANGTAAANVLGASALAAPINHIHKLGTHDHSDATKGANIGPTAFAAAAFTADVTGRAPFQDGLINAAKLANDALAADATGRAKMADNFFDAATAALKFEASAIPNDKVNWSFGGTPTAETPDVAGNEGSNTTVSRSDHVHAATAAAPSGYTLAAADAEGAASTFARSNHVHKAILNNQVYFVGRNNADGADINMVKINASDLVEFGANLSALTMGGTLTLAAQQISFSTGNVTFSGDGYVAIGASPADAGAGLRVPNNVYAVYVRNQAGGGNINMWKVNASDLIEAGVSLAALTMAGQLSMADQAIDFTTGYIEFGTTPAAAGDIRQENNVAVWASRNQAGGGDITGWKVNAQDDYEAAADVNMGGNVLYGDTAADGNLILHSTINATKGFVGIPNAHEGLKVGGTAVRGTPATNAIDLFDGTPPAGAIANGVTLYSNGGEFYAMDATGNSTLNSPHSDDGDFIIYSYSAKKKKTVAIHLEKLCNALATKYPAEFADFVEVIPGLKHKKADKVKLNW